MNKPRTDHGSNDFTPSTSDSVNTAASVSLHERESRTIVAYSEPQTPVSRK